MTAPAIRTQVDELNEEYSFETGLDCSDKPDLARQEFKDETDVNKVLARYGVDGQMRQPEYGEVDFNLDLQQSIEAIRQASAAIEKLPEALRGKYSTWRRFLDGVLNGEFKIDLATHYETERMEKAALDAEAARAASSREPIPEAQK